MSVVNAIMMPEKHFNRLNPRSESAIGRFFEILVKRQKARPRIFAGGSSRINRAMLIITKRTDKNLVRGFCCGRYFLLRWPFDTQLLHTITKCVGMAIKYFGSTFRAVDNPVAAVQSA